MHGIREVKMSVELVDGEEFSSKTDTRLEWNIKCSKVSLGVFEAGLDKEGTELSLFQWKQIVEMAHFRLQHKRILLRL